MQSHVRGPREELEHPLGAAIRILRRVEREGADRAPGADVSEPADQVLRRTARVGGGWAFAADDHVVDADLEEEEVVDLGEADPDRLPLERAEVVDDPVVTALQRITALGPVDVRQDTGTRVVDRRGRVHDVDPKLLVGERGRRQSGLRSVCPGSIPQVEVEAQARTARHRHVLIQDVRAGAGLIHHGGELAVRWGRHGESRQR